MARPFEKYVRLREGEEIQKKQIKTNRRQRLMLQQTFVLKKQIINESLYTSWNRWLLLKVIGIHTSVHSFKMKD